MYIYICDYLKAAKKAFVVPIFRLQFKNFCYYLEMFKILDIEEIEKLVEFTIADTKLRTTEQQIQL